jgi:hypothetical protein
MMSVTMSTIDEALYGGKKSRDFRGNLGLAL